MFFNIYFVVFIIILKTSVSKRMGNFEEKMILKSYFSDDVFTIDMTYANDSVNILGHALTRDVKQCVTIMQTFAPHCIKKAQNKWPKADRGYQRIPEFHFEIIENKNFSYYYDFGKGSPLFEGFKCCVIYDLLDCIHSEYKTKCFGLSFAPIDEVLHLFSMQVQDKCNGFHIDNKLFNAIINSGERFHLKEKNDDKSCEKRFLKNSDSLSPRKSFYLILVTILLSFKI